MKKRFFYLIGILLFCFICLSYLNYMDFGENLNLKITDKLYGNSPVQNIVIIEIDDKSINELGSWPIKRSHYATLIEKLNKSAVIGIDIGFYEYSNLEEDSILKNTINKYEKKIVLSSEYTNFEIINSQIHGKDLVLPIFLDEKSNFSVGYVNVIVDGDGVSRAINLDVQGDYNSFSENVLEKFVGEKIIFNQEDSNLNRYMINYAGVPRSFNYYSLSDILNEDFDTSVFNGKIVLVGASANSLHDNLLVPTSNGVLMPGVEIHANAIQTMLLGNNLKHSDFILEMIIIFITVFLTMFLISNLDIFKSSIILFILVFGYIFFVVLIFDMYNLILNIIYVPFGVIFTSFVQIIYYYKSGEKEKREIKLAFSKYVSPVLINELTKNPKKLKLGGEKKEIAILFSDIAGFTSISEKLDPEELVLILNEYLTEMTEIVLENRGLVDKFIGDAVMAFWGAPLQDEFAIENSLNTALLMQKKLDEIRGEWQEKYNVNIDVRIGLTFGFAIIGNMGSENRFDYTAIGDNVNLASRLEGINKEYGTNICVSMSIYEKAKKNFLFRELDLVKVKGKNKPTKIYELICSKEDLNSKKRESRKKLKNMILEFESALELYRKQDFEKAKKLFLKIYDNYKDKTSKIFVKRCDELKGLNLDKNWNGVYEMKSK